MAKKPDPPILLEDIPDEGSRNLLSYLGRRIARIAGLIDRLDVKKKEASQSMFDLAMAAGIGRRRLRADDEGTWSAAVQKNRHETIHKEKLLTQGWDVSCPHCQGTLTVVTPLKAIEAATTVKTGESWVVRRKPEKKEKGEPSEVD